MNDLYKALGDISSIRRQVAHSTEFRGYGPATLATTSGFAVGVQWHPEYDFERDPVSRRIFEAFADAVAERLNPAARAAAAAD